MLPMLIEVATCSSSGPVLSLVERNDLFTLVEGLRFRLTEHHWGAGSFGLSLLGFRV